LLRRRAVQLPRKLPAFVVVVVKKLLGHR
jgi:hypothetical protein